MYSNNESPALISSIRISIASEDFLISVHDHNSIAFTTLTDFHIICSFAILAKVFCKNMFVCGFSVSTPEFFTYIEMSPLPMKGFKF